MVDFVSFLWFLSSRVALWDKIDWTGKTGWMPEGGLTGVSDFYYYSIGPDAFRKGLIL